MKSVETIIISGSKDALDAVMEAETALVVDHRSEEEEVLSELKRFLPGFAFSCDLEDEVFVVTMNFNGRTLNKKYSCIPYNNFRILLDSVSLIRPQADIRVYEPTKESDTHVFVAAASNFWDRFNQEASLERKKLFESIDFLSSAWDLNGSSQSKKEKKWWQFWIA